MRFSRNPGGRRGSIHDRLAIDGGTPVRLGQLPYGQQTIEDQDVAAVVLALKSGWLTTGPEVEEFEREFALVAGTRYAVAVNSGTAALHSAVAALQIGPGDEVIVPAMTFAASASCIIAQGATPVFADVGADDLLIDPGTVESLVTPRTRAVIAVDYGGQPCEYSRLQALADSKGIAIIADACHSLGGTYRGRPVGSLADMTTFSLHPVKPITSGEGGVITTDSHLFAERMRRFRNHGIDLDHEERANQDSWFYEIHELGYNYRLTDIQCALARSQLTRLPVWTERRREIARRYAEEFQDLRAIRPLSVRSDVEHAYHLYIVQLQGALPGASRRTFFKALRAEGIGVNVHYVPVHMHPLYRRRFGTGSGLCPRAESAYEAILSLPIFPTMNEADIEDVTIAVRKVVLAFSGELREKVS